MSFYDKKVIKTVSGCDPEAWKKFAIIVKARNSDTSKTINRLVEEFVYRWQSDANFAAKPVDRQRSETTNYIVMPYYKQQRFYEQNSLDKAA